MESSYNLIKQASGEHKPFREVLDTIGKDDVTILAKDIKDTDSGYIISLTVIAYTLDKSREAYKQLEELRDSLLLKEQSVSLIEISHVS